MRYASLAGSMRGVFSADISWLTQTCDVLLKSCEALLQSCDVLFDGEKTGFLAKCASQPPILKQKSTSQVPRSASQATGCASQVARSTSQAARSTSQLARTASQVARTTSQLARLGRSTSQVHLVYTVELSHLTVQGRTF